jgi:hypothetical protein
MTDLEEERFSDWEKRLVIKHHYIIGNDSILTIYMNSDDKDGYYICESSIKIIQIGSIRTHKKYSRICYAPDINTTLIYIISHLLDSHRWSYLDPDDDMPLNLFKLLEKDQHHFIISVEIRNGEAITNTVDLPLYKREELFLSTKYIDKYRSIIRTRLLSMFYLLEHIQLVDYHCSNFENIDSENSITNLIVDNVTQISGIRIPSPESVITTTSSDTN